MSILSNYRTARIIKDGVDNVPTGVCFFDENDNLMLCNKKMSSLVFKITGRDLQLFSDIDSLTNQIYTIDDGTSWQFLRFDIVDEHKYTQFVASDVTEPNSYLGEIEAKRQELTEQTDHLIQLNRNITAIVREEEILSMKMQVHNELGSTILRMNQYYRNNCPADAKAELIESLKNTYMTLKEGTLSNENEGGIDDLIQIASKMGLDVLVSGNISFQNTTYRSIALSAVSECITNSVKHGKAQKMFVFFDDNKVSITNDGIAPSPDAVEGGGLSSLRKKVINSGGNMNVTFTPNFILTVSWRTGK